MTIPSTNTQLLVTEDWTKIYQSLKNADFQSYDFETIRRVLISYIQENFPEDFNDYIDSSEFIALIDVISFLGQNLSFRIDLNARENFLETAQRRESVLRLAQLISYAPKRNRPASGLLKITAISTTENISDSTGVNLANTTVEWSDPTNNLWYEQFTTILNSAMPGQTVFGKPNDRATLNGILTEQYQLNTTNQDIPVFSFSKNINGTGMTFEVVPATFSGKPYIYESTPKPAAPFNIIYQNDNQGSGSSNSGFFAMFKQGTLGLSSFNISNPVPNEIIGVNVSDINDTDVWLWQLEPSGNYPDGPWTKVPSIVGSNVIYNSIAFGDKNLYSITTRDNDQIDINFTDGNFGNLPKGTFQLFYRQSNGLSYTIRPQQLSGVIVRIPYLSKSGQNHTLTVTLSLQYTISNSAGTETSVSIQQNAPQTYYLQNRMVTGEDYNIAPLTLTSGVLKVKSMARTVSGVSKYFDLSDVSAKYSSANIFGTDGVVYKNENEKNFVFSFNSRNEIFSVFRTTLASIIGSNSLLTFYHDKFRTHAPVTLNSNVNVPTFEWNNSNIVTGQSRGYFYSKNRQLNVNVPQSVGSFTSGILRYITPGALIKFVPPKTKFGEDQYFLPNGKIVSVKTNKTVDYVWSTVMQVVGDGANVGLGNLSDGTGPIILGNRPGQGAIPVEIIPTFDNSLTYTFENDLTTLCLSQRNFGLRFDSVDRIWKIIEDTNLDLVNPFTLDYEADITNTNKDSSWIIAFTWVGTQYKVRYRNTSYIFHSDKQTGFYTDQNDVNFDYVNNSVVRDKISVLSINEKTGTNLPMGVDHVWQIDGPIVELDGYINPARVEVSFYNHQDSGRIGQIINPDIFNDVVGTYTNGTSDGFVLFKFTADGMDFDLVDPSLYLIFASENAARQYYNNELDAEYLYYFVDTGTIKSANVFNEFVFESGYVAYPGRSNLRFHYQHNSGEEFRIDPSKSNLIDIYMLTNEYDTEFRNWLLTTTGSEPLPPSSYALESNYAGVLEPIKTVSDELIFQPVRYKVLFGESANINLQAKFKAVKSPSSTLSNNEIISNILTGINTFFSLENWEFGKSFHFSELSTYIMNLLTPDITNFVIVPTINNFGSLYEVACQSNEIFISGAKASDIEVIDAITATQLNTTLINAG
jgi:hypothetical protein